MLSIFPPIATINSAKAPTIRWRVAWRAFGSYLIQHYVLADSKEDAERIFAKRFRVSAGECIACYDATINAFAGEDRGGRNQTSRWLK